MTAQAVAEVSGPGWYGISADLVSPEQAAEYFASQPKMMSEKTDLPVSSAEIDEMARALLHDPVLIYEYVLNHIDYVPYYGYLKGPVLTMMEGSGNDFDQAALLVALLKASEFSPHYAFGSMTIPNIASDENDMTHWLGMEPTSDREALKNRIRKMMGSGGFTGSINLDALTINRMCVQVEIEGTTYTLDPAFKLYERNDGIDLKTAMGYDQNVLLRDAGGREGPDYIQNLNDSAIRYTLDAKTMNLVNYIRSNYPNAGMEEILGSREIISENFENRALPTAWTFPFWNIQIMDEIPENEIHKISIQYGGDEGINALLHIPDIAGRRLSISYAEVTGGYAAQLWLDDTDTPILSEPSPSIDSKLILNIDHPYPGGTLGDYADQRSESSLVRGRDSTYVIVYDFGGSAKGELLKRRQEILKKYTADGFDITSREVLSECLNVMGMSWMKQTTLSDQMMGAISKTKNIVHHRVGVTAQEAGYYLDIMNQQFSRITEDGNFNSTTYRATGLLDSALEHSVLEQYQKNRPAVSTVKLLKIANDSHQKVFYATNDNYSGVREELEAEEENPYSTGDLNSFNTLVQNGYTLLLPQSSQIQLLNWSGKAYIQYWFLEDRIEVGMKIQGGLNGGFVAVAALVDLYDLDEFVNLKTNEQYGPRVSASDDPVSMATGAFMSGGMDLSLGTGGMRGVAFSRSYNSANNKKKTTMGYGWSHNYDIHADVFSDSESGLGMRQPVDAASIIVAAVATMGLMEDDQDVKKWMVSALIADWALDRLKDNAVSIYNQGKALTYIKLPDESYNPPPGETLKLVKENEVFKLYGRFGVTYMFNSDNKIAAITDADENALNFTYSDGKLHSVSDGYNHTLTFDYSGDLMTNVSDLLNSRHVSYEYNTKDVLIKYTDPDGKEWQYAYDDDNRRMIRVIDPLNITSVTNEYDSQGRVIRQEVPRQGVTNTYKLYFSGFRNVEEDTLGNEEDDLKNQTVYYFDDKGRQVCIEDPLHNKSYAKYDGQNHVIESTDPRGNVTAYTYDGNQNLVKVEDALHKEINFTYDDQFGLTEVTDPLTHTRSNGYDGKHHLTSVTVYPQADKQIKTTRTYYENGLPKTATNAKSVVTTITYDGYGYPDTTTVASNPPVGVNYDYDPIGRMTSLTDQKGAQTAFAYDALGLIQNSTDPLGKSTVFTYNNDGRIKTVKDRNQRTTTYTYTPTGKTNRVTFADATSVSFGYDIRDNVVSMHDSVGTTTTYAYDAANRLISTTDAQGFAVSYAYDEAGNLTTLTYPGDNKTVTYTYDELNRVETVTINWITGSPTVTYHYDDAGRMTGYNQFNGTTVGYTYDHANRITGLANQKDDAEVIYSCNFTLDANGNRINADEETATPPGIPPKTTTYAYDANGTRLQTAGWVYNHYDKECDESGHCRLIARPAAAGRFGYDDEGQQTQYLGAYTFDDLHRLISVSGSVDDHYIYDRANNRIRADRGDDVTKYIYGASGNLLAEADANNVITRYYIYGASGLLAMVTAAGELYCYHYDANANTRALTNADGTVVVNTYEYLPFGEIMAKTEWISQPFTFVGQYGVMSEPNGLYYMRARYYNPRLGRFISQDPAGFGGGDVNLYVYCMNNSVMLIDPLGFCGTTIDINRTTYTGNSIVGTINVSNPCTSSTFSGYTLENISPPNSNLPVPSGTYSATVRTDHTPNRIEINNVPNASNIQIHVGNSANDVQGCFAVGETTTTDWVGNSTNAMNMINQITSAGGDITVNLTGSPTGH